MSDLSSDALLALVQRALGEMERDAVADDDAQARFEDWVCSANWLFALAAPHLFRDMSRAPSRPHLLRVADSFIARARRGDRNDAPDFEPVPYEQREPLARKLRSLIETWTPPDLTQEVVETARALLYADGKAAPVGGWDAATIEGEDSLEDVLFWFEGVPKLLR